MFTSQAERQSPWTSQLPFSRDMARVSPGLHAAIQGHRTYITL